MLQGKAASSGEGIQEQGFESSRLGQTWGWVSFGSLADSLTITPGTSTLSEPSPLPFPAAGDVGGGSYRPAAVPDTCVCLHEISDLERQMVRHLYVFLLLKFRS